jgi:hypothetical protein
MRVAAMMRCGDQRAEQARVVADFGMGVGLRAVQSGVQVTAAGQHQAVQPRQQAGQQGS